MLYFALAAVAALVVALDQVSKAAIVTRYASYVSSFIAGPLQTGAPFSGVPETETVPLLPGVAHATFYPNTGAAWSIGTGKTWIFIAVTFVFLALVVYALRKKWFTGAALWGMALVVGGGVGNLLDRIVRGFVVDMIEVEFFSFPVFNVADCCICIGGGIVILATILEETKK